jgi:hypothetical protein
MFRRSIIEEAGFYDESLIMHQEFEYFFRVLLIDSQFDFVSEAVMKRRMHDSQLSKMANTKKWRRSRAALAYRKAFTSFKKAKVHPELLPYFRARLRTDSYQLSRELRLVEASRSLVMYLEALLLDVGNFGK